MFCALEHLTHKFQLVGIFTYSGIRLISVTHSIRTAVLNRRCVRGLFLTGWLPSRYTDFMILIFCKKKSIVIKNL